MTCNVCGTDIESGIAKARRCTNRRCGGCHDRYCTGGGSTSPGHGLGNPPKVPVDFGGPHAVKVD